MAGYITAQELSDASVDAGTLEKYVNSPAGTENVNRAGQDVGTLSDLTQQALEIAAAGGEVYLAESFTSLQAITPSVTPAIGRVLSGAAPGYYSWDGSAWSFMQDQPATAAEVKAALKNGYVFTGKITKAVFNFSTSEWVVSHSQLQFDLGGGRGFVRVSAASNVVIPNGRALIADLRGLDGTTGPVISGVVTDYDISSISNGSGAFVEDLRIPIFVNRVANGATNIGGLLAARPYGYGAGEVWFKSAASTSVSYDDSTRELSWNGGIFCPMAVNGSTRINLAPQAISIPNSNYQIVWLDLSQIPTPNGDFPPLAVKVGGYNDNSDTSFKGLPHQLPIFYRERAGVYGGIGGFPYGRSSGSSSAMPSGLEISKEPTAVTFHFLGSGGKKVEIRFVHETVLFDGTTPNSQLDNWRLVGGWETSAEYVRGNQIINTGEWEMALRLSGETDSVGGYHGDELLRDMLFLIDGVPIGSADTVTRRSVREVQALQNSYVFDQNVQAIIDAGTGLPINAIAKHSKRYYFTPEGIRIGQRLEWLQDRTLVSAWVAMLPILRNRDSTSGPLITDAAIRSRLFEAEDLSTWNESGTLTYTPVEDGDSVTLWGETSGISATIQFTRTPNLPNQKVYISTNTSAYNKVYFNLRGDATAGDPLISALTGDVWEWESLYQINTAN